MGPVGAGPVRSLGINQVSFGTCKFFPVFNVFHQLGGYVYNNNSNKNINNNDNSNNNIYIYVYT